MDEASTGSLDPKYKWCSENVHRNYSGGGLIRDDSGNWVQEFSLNIGHTSSALTNGYFMKGMEKEAMECYEEDCGENSKLKMSDEISCEFGSFNVIVDGYCTEGKFKEAIDVSRSMCDYRCSPGTLSFNNLIDQLCQDGLLGEAEELYGGMGAEGVNPDEYTCVLLMDACFKVDRVDDGTSYFRKMVQAGLRPSLAVYNRLVDELVKAGKVDEAKSFYETMVKKLKMDDASYEFMMKALSDVGKLDDAWF
ncbi:Pentatricopeptide repeat-containing protein [Hibiscus syriacus]|uniref:Pentatricopeptide repeat-containing protein n=1 Tax=Hibiscus syriacus TaxID=106335 RepID=A0A6A3CIN0_HIBSY|nr:Pentatricopeptide repeat-containing protein [Hibiscus syriacus]